MVTLPPLSEGAYSQLRAALEERSARISRQRTIAEMHVTWTDSKSSQEELDFLTTALFWTNDAILTVEGAAEVDAIGTHKWEQDRHESWTAS